MSIVSSKKQIEEVALPLDDNDVAATREKSIRHGYHSTLHLWWARLPPAAARAAIFEQMVNDPDGPRGYAQGENVALEFKEARPKDSLKYLKMVVAFANGRGWRMVSGTSRQFE